MTLRHLSRLQVFPVAVALLLATPALRPALRAQDDVASAKIAARRPWRPNVLAFADTAAVRFEGTWAAAGMRAGAPVRATIARVSDGALLWSGEVGRLTVNGDTARVVGSVGKLRPMFWSPQSPALYRAVVQVEGASAADTVRFGFRTIRAEHGRIVLNGRPVFLRGNAINPPGRNLPDSLDETPAFARDYVRYLKRVGVNIIRLSAPSQPWFDACDELGMMVFQGHYGTPKGATPTSPPKDVAAALRWYRDEVIAPQANHPSVVIYTLSNEQAAREIPYLSTGAESVARFLQTAYDTLSRWDNTRLYIGNAGYGFGRAGEICDLHRYWGWYYNTALSFYTLRDPRVCWRSSTVQPITLTENTGNYTGPDGRFNLASKTKQPDSQLNWTGHAPNVEQGPRALTYQAWMAGQAIELTRRLRERNPYLAGLSPFTIAVSNWSDVKRFADMGPKPVLAQYARSYQPVLLSWEAWAMQAYAGTTVRTVAHVVNDADDGRPLGATTLRWALADSAGAVRARGEAAMPAVPFYGAASRPVGVVLPASLSTGRYLLVGALVGARGDTVSRNETRLMVAARDYAGRPGALARRVRVYDPAGTTARALTALGVTTAPVRTVAGLDPARDAFVVGAAAWDAGATRDTATLGAFVRAGGRVLVLDQRAGQWDGAWLPGGVRVQNSTLDHSLVFPGGRPFAQGMAINPERPDHPAFAGLTRDDFFLWSDYTNWNEATPGFPAVYPVAHGFALTRPQDFGRVALLADYDHGLEGVALVEAFEGRGSAVLSAFDLVPRVGRDPVADRLLVNLVRYVAGDAPHEAHPLIANKVMWGDYSSEHGLVTGIHSGLIVHTVPMVPDALAPKYPLHTDDEGFAYAGTFGGWNTRPAIQYVARGRRPFGPYEFTSGGAVRVTKGHEGMGEGRVWLRVPAERTAMTTLVENPTDSALAIEIAVDGVATRHTVAPRATARIETPLGGTGQPAGRAAALAPRTLALTFRGDRRLVIRETEFR